VSAVSPTVTVLSITFHGHFGKVEMRCFPALGCLRFTGFRVSTSDHSSIPCLKGGSIRRSGTARRRKMRRSQGVLDTASESSSRIKTAYTADRWHFRRRATAPCTNSSTPSSLSGAPNAHQCEWVAIDCIPFDRGIIGRVFSESVSVQALFPWTNGSRMQGFLEKASKEGGAKRLDIGFLSVLMSSAQIHSVKRGV
jgi:hypothetical protein